MTNSFNNEALAAARAYEALHVPALFQEWVEPVLDAAGVQEGQSVLDVACGTGVLTRGARRRVGNMARVLGVDPDPGMLGVARELDASIDWREDVAESLPLEDEAVDAVVSQFGMMFFSDRKKAATEMLRVLRPGGRMAVAVWDALENQPAYLREVALLDEMVGKKAGDALRAPFVLGDAEQLRAELEEAGFEAMQVKTRVGTGRFPDIRTLVGADLRGWLPVMGVHLDEDTIEGILSAADRQMAHFVSGGTVIFNTPAHVISGMKPET